MNGIKELRFDINKFRPNLFLHKSKLQLTDYSNVENWLSFNTNKICYFPE